MPTKRLRGDAYKRFRFGYLRDHPLCVYCLARGRVTQGTVVDHKLPLVKGGDYRDENLQTLCDECHKDKTATDRGVKRRKKIGFDSSGNPTDPIPGW